MTKDLEIVIGPDAQAQIDAMIARDPAAKEALAELFAAMHQASHAVQEGRYASMEDAIEAITGNRPQRIG